MVGWREGSPAHWELCCRYHLWHCHQQHCHHAAAFITNFSTDRKSPRRHSMETKGSEGQLWAKAESQSIAWSFLKGKYNLAWQHYHNAGLGSSLSKDRTQPWVAQQGKLTHLTTTHAPLLSHTPSFPPHSTGLSFRQPKMYSLPL